MHSILLSPLAFIGRHATRFLALAVVIGFAIPPLSTLVRPWLAAFIVLPLVIALMRIDWADPFRDPFNGGHPVAGLGAESRT